MLNWIVCDGTVFVCSTELFEIKRFICIKMDLTLNNVQRLICHKTQTTKQIELLYNLQIVNKNCTYAKLYSLK